MKAYNSIQLNLENSIEISQFLELMLDEAGYSKERIIRYSFLIEEVLINWRAKFPSDTVLLLERLESRNNIALTLSFKGVKSNPLTIDTNAVSEKMPIEVMHDRLLSGVGCELQYKYTGDSNKLILSLPKTNIEEKIYKKNLLLLMIPVIFQSLLNTIAHYTDAFMLGFLDADSMSAVSLSASFCDIQIYLATAICVTATSLVSQYWGKRDRTNVSNNINFSFISGIALSLIFSLLTFFAPYQVISFYTDVESIRILGAQYLRIISPSYILVLIYMVSYTCLRILGKGKTAFYFALIGCVVNVILNALFIFGLFGIPQMGVTGAAIATISCQFVQCAACAIYFLKNKDLGYSFSLRFMDFRKRLRSFIKTFLPVGGQYMSWMLATNIITMAFGHLGADVIAANAFLVIIAGLATSIRNGVSTATGIAVGGLLGKNRLKEAEEKGSISFKIGISMGIVCSLLFALSGFLLRFMPLDLSEKAVSYINLMLITYTFNVFFGFLNGIMCDGAFHIGGDSKALFIIDTSIMWGIYVTVSLLGTYVFKFPVIFMALFLKSDEILTFPVKYYRYRMKKWVKNLTK